MGNCSFENSQLRTFSLLALLLTRFLSSAKTRPQCSFNTCNSLKASSPEFKRRNIAVSCLSTLSRFALDAISNKKNMRNMTHDFPSFPEFPASLRWYHGWYTIAQQNQGQCIRVYPKSENPAIWLAGYTSVYPKVTIFSNIEPRTVSTNWLIADAILYEDFPKTQLNLRQVLGELSMKKSFDIKAGFS